MSARLAPVTTTTSRTFTAGLGSRTRPEIWEARTTDGRFLIERVEITGTPWDVYELDAAGKPVRFVNTYGTLRRARLAIAAGECEQVQHLAFLDLPWIVVERGGIVGRFATEAEARASLAPEGASS